jgi:hypothetical protein
LLSTTILSQHWSTIQGCLFPLLKEKLGPLSRQHLKVITTIELVRVEDFIKVYFGYVGRPPKDRVAIAHAFIAKAVLNLPFTSSLLDRLAVDRVLRQICGWERKASIPSESTFSRAFAEFANSQLLQKVHESLIKKNLGDHLFGHVSRDSTAIKAREKKCKKTEKLESVTQGSDVMVKVEAATEVSEKKSECTPAQEPHSSGKKCAKGTAPKRKRGRPKNSKKKIKPPTRLERQQKMSLEEMLDDLPKSCDMGCKRSKGYKETWKGFKLHIDAADGQMPISCILTSASLADSQAAIPLSVMTSQRITNLYDLMDSAYDSEIIKENSRSLGHVPIIEMNPRANKKKQEESKAEPKRLKCLNIQMPATVRYKERNSVERVNGRLKNEFGGNMVQVRGDAKVMTHLMFGIVALTADQLMRFIM